ISLVSKSDVNWIIVLATVILLVLFFIKDSLIKVTYDEDNAEASGVNTKLINLIFIILVSMLITLAIPITGILLLSVLIILPVIVSTQISWSFKSTIVIAEIISILSVIS
ncbi:MAG: iron chelate uptake ABC transporter family permease subunit, partial [bacterium]|nr:iron chelate uptake ABC transporter family permease subunit [bacterium]